VSNETHIGDGLYASVNGYEIKLRAPREGGDHWVALEPYAFALLLRFEGLSPELREHWRGLARAALSMP